MKGTSCLKVDIECYKKPMRVCHNQAFNFNQHTVIPVIEIFGIGVLENHYCCCLLN